MLDRRKDAITNEEGVLAKWGVPPASIPDWLALVGDTADGYPGLPGWGKKTASTVLAAHGTIEAIPDDPAAWRLNVGGASALAATLAAQRDDALLFKRLATLRLDAPVTESLDDLAWCGARPELRGFLADLGIGELEARVPKWRDSL